MSNKENRPIRPNRPKAGPPLPLKLAEIMLSLFRGREDRVGIGTDTGIVSRKVDEPLAAEELADLHLGQKTCFAFYPLTAEGEVGVSCIDLDNKEHKPDADIREKVVLFVDELRAIGLKPLVEVSQSGKGYHIWLFFQESLPASVVRAFWVGLCAKLDLPVPEIFPKQVKLKEGQVGNCIRYPLFNQSCFINVDADNSVLDPLATLQSVESLSLADLEAAAELGEISLEPLASDNRVGDEAFKEGELPPRVVRLLVDPDSHLRRRWEGNSRGMNDTSRSSIMAALACELVRKFVPTLEIEAALRIWCETHGYSKGLEAGRLPRVIASAYDHVAQSSRVVSKSKNIFHNIQ